MNMKTVIMTLIVALSMVGMAAADTVYDNSMVLENKDGNWNIIEDEYNVTLEYNDDGEEFEWSINGTVPANNEEYCIIYYADKPDKFKNWGGNNPGAILGTITSDNNGNVTMSDSKYLGHDLPHINDSNIDGNDGSDYCESDNYTNCHGAKIWMVPSANYDEIGFEVTTWDQITNIYETNMINYTYTEEVPGAEENVTVIEIGDGTGVCTIPITITPEMPIGACDLTVTYDSAICAAVGVTTGAHEYYISEPGIVRILGFQVNASGLDEEYMFASVDFEPVTDMGSSPLEITVTTIVSDNASTVDEQVPYTVINGTYYLGMMGDVNGDGEVDMLDVDALAEYLISGDDTGLNTAAMDVTGNGEIDVADCMYLAYHINGVPGFENLDNGTTPK